MWELYDELIEGIPSEWKAERIVCGVRNCFVLSEAGGGISHTMYGTVKSATFLDKYDGMPLRDLAACVKSWEYGEASLGHAALNAYYNSVPQMTALGVEIAEASRVEDRKADPFIMGQNDMRDKTVTMIGRFPYVDKLLAPICDLRVIAKYHPLDGDYPEEAAEYLLPGSDFVFLPSYAFVEKTLPRFLKLAGGAFTTIVGPATTLAPSLFRHGVHDLSGFVVKDAEA
ncbi:MAG: DUF364 domain-containing protein, partial [Clostridiales Family XIII bacterium]|nr:DUF364 domain-containing protein [Clostridiales Family XIII bacterium]